MLALGSHFVFSVLLPMHGDHAGLEPCIAYCISPLALGRYTIVFCGHMDLRTWQSEARSFEINSNLLAV